MPKTAFKKPLLVGIAGGTGSGKSELAGLLLRGLRGRATLVCQDWYYRDRSGVPLEKRAELNVDHPSAIETALLVKDLLAIRAGKAIHAPRYDYATQSRQAERVLVASAEIVLVEGLFVLHEERVRRLLDLSVYIDVPADVRLMRRIRRDLATRGIPVEETLRLYERYARPMHERYVEPSAKHATHVWKGLEDRGFPARFKREVMEKAKN